MNTHAQLKIGIPSISEKINHLEIHSVSEYVIFDDLLRSLVKFDSNGEISPDLAESWKIEEEFKKFTLKIKPNQHFSDGSLITAEDIKESLLYLAKHPSIIHGNGNKFKKISVPRANEVEIILEENNPFFLMELSAPEYRISKTMGKYQVTSGPYYVTATSSTKLSLKLNEYYPFENKVKFKEVEYSYYQLAQANKLLDMDIIWPTSTISLNEIEEFQRNGYYVYKMNIGFSYWLSLNPNTLNFDERIQIKNELDLILKNETFFEKNNLTRSKQLFLPFGPGRITDEELLRLNSTLPKLAVSKLKKIKILLPKSLQPELLTAIKQLTKKVEISFYKDFSHYSELIKKNTFDVALVNNDLSSIDLRSSLVVTFNPSRPLVWTPITGDNNYKILIDEISTELNSQKRYSKIKTLGENLLKDVLVYPLYYDYGFILAKKNIDLSALNKSGAETYSWKIK